MLHPIDEFLNSHNFHRKNTNAGPSNLFRVISEQMYDTQNHHRTVRLKCVAYMKKNENYFKKFLSGDFDDYLEKMELPTTYGSRFELRAIALMYGRNVIIFKKFDLGNFFLHRQYFKRTFLVFQWSKQCFNTIFTKSTFTNLAICQSICYDLLYKDVFRFPDVDLAVEKCLRPMNLSSTEKYEVQYNEKGYADRIYFFEDGRSIKLNGPEETQCILKNCSSCHFHMDDCKEFCKYFQRNKYKNENFVEMDSKAAILSNKFNSCTFQLIIQGYLVIPYKVALGLAPNKYYNIELDYFDSKAILPAYSYIPRNVSSKLFHYRNNDVPIECECKEVLMNMKQDKFNRRIGPYEDNLTEHIQHLEPDNEPVNENLVIYAIILFSMTLISYLCEYFFK